MLKKNMVVGLILLFVVIASTPAVIGIQEKTYNTPSSEDDRAGWKTNYFCRINVNVDGAWCEPDLGIGFIRYAECRGDVNHCSISGSNGTDIIENGEWVHIRVKYLFGYTYLWWQSWLSEFYMKGFAIKCEYKVGKN